MTRKQLENRLQRDNSELWTSYLLRNLGSKGIFINGFEDTTVNLDNKLRDSGYQRLAKYYDKDIAYLLPGIFDRQYSDKKRIEEELDGEINLELANFALDYLGKRKGICDSHGREELKSKIIINSKYSDFEDIKESVTLNIGNLFGNGTELIYTFDNSNKAQYKFALPEWESENKIVSLGSPLQNYRQAGFMNSNNAVNDITNFIVNPLTTLEGAIVGYGIGNFRSQINNSLERANLELENKEMEKELRELRGDKQYKHFKSWSNGIIKMDKQYS